MDSEDGSRQLGLPLARPVAVLALRSQLAPVAWAFARGLPGGRLGYVRIAGGGALGGRSHVVGALRERRLLAGSLTVGTSPGREGEAITTAGALHDGLRELGWDAVVCDAGAESAEDGTPFGPAAMAALDCAHAALALGCATLVVPRMCSGDARRRRRGISQDTLTVLDLLLEPVSVALPAGMRSPVGAELHAGLRAVFGAPSRTAAQAPPTLDMEPLTDRPARIARHDWRRAAVDLPGFAAAGLPAQTSGSGPLEDPLCFGGALAGGAVLAELAVEAGYGERDEEGEGAAA